LPANEVRVSKLSGNIKTVGNKWADLEMEKYGSFQQPLYVVVDSDGNDLTEAIGYTPDIKTYKAFLTKGMSAFKK
jgi:thiol:disulfide interchange protein DsbD